MGTAKILALIQRTQEVTGGFSEEQEHNLIPLAAVSSIVCGGKGESSDTTDSTGNDDSGLDQRGKGELSQILALG